MVTSLYKVSKFSVSKSRATFPASKRSFERPFPLFVQLRHLQHEMIDENDDRKVTAKTHAPVVSFSEASIT